MRKRPLLLFFAVGLVSLTGLVFVRIANWNSLERVIPIQETGSTHTSLPEPSGSRDPSVNDAHSLQQTPSQEFGSISGRVIDAQGRPVANVDVLAFGSGTQVGIVPTAHTNSSGIFKFRSLEVGEYSLSVGTSYAGEADTQFYAAGFVENPIVLVEEGKTIWCGDLRVGPKAGRLVGTIRDSITGKLIVSIDSPGERHLVLRRTQDPNNSWAPGIDIRGNFEVLVPPIPFTLEVIVAGYEKKNMGILNLKSGETRRLDIMLQRSASTSKNL